MKKKNIYISDFYKEKNPDWHSSDSKFKLFEILKILKKNNINLKKICDIGCGSGNIIFNLSKIYKESLLHGYEISPYAYKISKKKKNRNLIFFNKDINNINTFYDCSLCIDVFEHVDNYIGFLNKIKKISQYSIFHVPLDLSVQSIIRTRPIFYARKNVGHLHYFNKEILLEIFKDLDFEILDFHYTFNNNIYKSKSIIKIISAFCRNIFFKISPNFTAKYLGGYSIMILTKNN